MKELLKRKCVQLLLIKKFETRSVVYGDTSEAGKRNVFLGCKAYAKQFVKSVLAMAVRRYRPNQVGAK